MITGAVPESSRFEISCEQPQIRLQIRCQDDNLWHLRAIKNDLADKTARLWKQIKCKAVRIFCVGKNQELIVEADGADRVKAFRLIPLEIIAAVQRAFNNVFCPTQPIMRVALAIGRLSHHGNQWIAIAKLRIIEVLPIVTQ